MQLLGRNISWKIEKKNERRLELTADCLIVLSVLLYVTSILSHVKQ